MRALKVSYMKLKPDTNEHIQSMTIPRPNLSYMTSSANPPFSQAEYAYPISIPSNLLWP